MPNARSKRRLAVARVFVVALLLQTAVLVLASSASAGEGSTIINRCIHGQSLSGFSQQAYREALQNLPTEVEEYTPCANLIRHAELSAAGGGSSASEPSSSSAPLPLSPAERTALSSIPKVGAAPQRIGNQIVRPGVVHANIASALSSLPTSLIAMLAFLLVCALVLAGRAIRHRVHARRAR